MSLWAKWKKRLGNLLKLLFPRAGGAAAEPPDRVVTTGCLAKDAALALEIATSLHDAEVRRRQSADTKAALYIAFLAAILPVVGTLEPTVSSRFLGPMLALDITLFMITLTYIVMAGWYAVRATAVSRFTAIGEKDLSDALDNADARATMAFRLIDATRLNYPINNEKITYVNLTQKCIFRAFLAIILIVAVDWGANTITAIGEERRELSGTPTSQVCSPLDLSSMGGGSEAGGKLRYYLPESGDAPVCLPLSIAADGVDQFTATPQFLEIDAGMDEQQF